MSWDLKSLPKLFASTILQKLRRGLKINNYGKKIGVYGDYDVDGTTSYLLAVFKSLSYDNVALIQPSRFVEGYGLHKSSIDDAVARDRPLITVDCGITMEAAIQKKKGWT